MKILLEPLTVPLTVLEFNVLHLKPMIDGNGSCFYLFCDVLIMHVL